MPHEAKKSKIDWDKVLAYQTLKTVRIKDRWLGLLYWGIVLIVCLYILIVRFMIEGKHQTQEYGVGTVFVGYSGKAFVGEKPLDAADLRFPEIEPNGAFLMTKQIIVSQKKGTCVDWDTPERCPCSNNQVCNGEFCEMQGWCPSIGEYNAATPPEDARIEEVSGLNMTSLGIHVGITFPSISDNFFASDTAVTRKFRNITIAKLLKHADPPILFDDLKHTGGIVGISFLWNCDVYTKCEPTVEVKRLDAPGQGFVKKRVQYKKENGETVRDAYYMYGIKFMVSSAGLGKRNSFMLIMLEIGSGLALMRTASMAADFMMLNLYGKQRREAYYKCKVMETRDYSDVQDRITLIQDEKEKNAARARLSRQSRTVHAV